MVKLTRHGDFNVVGLNSEIDRLLRIIEELSGKIVDELPPVSLVSENSRFFIKQDDESYKEYIKLNGNYEVLN